MSRDDHQIRFNFESVVHKRIIKFQLSDLIIFALFHNMGHYFEDYLGYLIL